MPTSRRDLANGPRHKPTAQHQAPLRNLNLGIAAGRSRIYRRHNLCDVQSNQRPLRSAQHHNGDSAARKILLVSDIFVSGKKNVEPGPLRFG